MEGGLEAGVGKEGLGWGLDWAWRVGLGVRELPIGLVRCRRLATLGSCPGNPPEMGAPPLVALDGLGLLGRLVQLE